MLKEKKEGDLLTIVWPFFFINIFKTKVLIFSVGGLNPRVAWKNLDILKSLGIVIDKVQFLLSINQNFVANLNWQNRNFVCK